MKLTVFSKTLLLSTSLLLFTACGGGGGSLPAAKTTIEAYADNNSQTAPTVQDYIDAGVVGVTDANLAQVNALVDSLTAEDVDTVEEINALVRSIVALANIEAYAEDGSQTAPTVQDYIDAGVTGVTEANLAQVNALIDSLTAEDVDTVEEINALVVSLGTSTVPVEDTQSIIEAYADDNSQTAPTVQDYIDAGVTGVTEANLAQVNALVDSLTAEDVDTVEEINALVVSLGTSTVPVEDTQSIIEAYADNNSQTAPTVQDYIDAGVVGVTDANLAQVNALVDSLTAEDVDTVEEINALVRSIVALANIEAYAEDGSQTAPTVQDYIDAGVTGVTEANLAQINALVDSLTAEDLDTVEEINALVASLGTSTVPVGNTAPTAEAGIDRTVEVNHGVRIMAEGTDAEGDVGFVWRVEGDDAILAQIPVFDYVPRETGPKYLTVSVTDNQGLMTADSMLVMVIDESSNNAPVAIEQTVSVEKDTTDNAITLVGTDVDYHPLTYTLLTQPTHGTVILTDGVVKYTPTANYVGTDSFDFKVNDGTVDSAFATVTINVT